MKMCHNAPVHASMFNRRQWLWLAALVLFVAGFVLYGRTLSYGFVELDDPLLIFENPAVQSFTWANLKTIFSTYDPELYIPLTLLSFMIDGALGGMHPFLFHLHNVLQHILNAWLFFLIARRLSRNDAIGIIASALFLVHPVNAEAVIWASGRKDLLSTTFFLLSLCLYLHASRIRRDWLPAYAASLLSFLLGLLSKVTVVSLAPILFLIDWMEGRKMTRRTLAEKIPYFALAVIFAVIALFGKTGAQPLPVLTRILTSAHALMFSLEKIVLPFGLSPMYAYAGPIGIRSIAFAVPVLLTTGLMVIAIAQRSAWKPFSAAVAFILLAYAPSFGNLVKNGEYYVTSDRYSYIPLLALCLLAAAGLERLRAFLTPQLSARGASLASGSIAAAIIVALSAITALHSPVWANTLTLSTHVVQVSPDARLGYLWHGNALRDSGAPEEALPEYDLALSMKEDPQVLYNRALAYDMLDRGGEALAGYRRALELEPHYALAHINLGQLLYASGKKNEARKEFEAAMTDAPHLAISYYNLGVLEGEEKNFGKAAELYLRALERDPDLHDARANLAIAYLALDRAADAVEQLKETLRRDPENPTALATLQRLMEAGIVRADY